MCKITIIGASGGIGQTLSLLLRLDEQISHLSLYSHTDSINGVAIDLDHIHTNNNNKLSHHFGLSNLPDALKGSEIVLVLASAKLLPGVTRESFFNSNAELIVTIGKHIAASCPNANMLLITNPVNGLVPLMCKTLDKFKVLNVNRVIGVTGLDSMRANKFLLDELNENSVKIKDIDVPVIGGHSALTMVPLFNQIQHKLNNETEHKLVNRVQHGGGEVKEAKKFLGTATLSTAKVCFDLVKAIINGGEGYGYVSTLIQPNLNKLVNNCPYFGWKLKLSIANGVDCILAPKEELLLPLDLERINLAVQHLKKDIQLGLDYQI